MPFERLHHEPMVDARDMLNAEEKLRIGREAIHEVPEHGSVIIDSGLDRASDSPRSSRWIAASTSSRTR